MSGRAALHPYPSPDEAQQEIAELARRFPERCLIESIAQSTEQRPVAALRLRGARRDGPGARLLVTAHIHAVEYIGAFVARAVARQLVEGYGRMPHITNLLDRADVWMVPLLNPDGAARIWRANGWTHLRGSRFTTNGVDPNRNFPFVADPGRRGWTTGSTRPGSPYYRGPHPLSEPECLGLARLCWRERFCAAINFHSFGGVVFTPEVRGPDAAKAAHVLEVFKGPFQSHQRHCRYRTVPEHSAKIVGQLDPFLLYGFGTPSVTVEVSRPDARLLRPSRLAKFFWWANPTRPEYWVENDADATIHALRAVLDRSAGTPCAPAYPQLADVVPG